MRVLFLTQVFPYPLDAGPKVRAYYVLRQLARQHTVTLLSFVRASDTAAAQAVVAADCVGGVHSVPISRSRWQDAWFFIKSVFTGEPLLITRDALPAMFAKLRELLASQTFDAIHTDQIWMVPYADAAVRWLHEQGKPRPRLVLDQHNATYLVPQRLAAASKNLLVKAVWWREAQVMARYEAAACQRFDRVVTLTPEDNAALQRIMPSEHRRDFPVIPICIDPASITASAQLSDQPQVLFLGGLHWPPNADGVRWFVREVWPDIIAELPAARCVVVGKQPPSELQQAPPTGWQFPGFVPDPQPYWQAARVFIVPLRAGGGMRVKILDAWAHACPIVATSIGAEGIQYHAGTDILIADQPVEFAAAVLRVLREPVFGQQLAQAGRATVAANYNWRTVYAAWDKIYDFSDL